jgi:hypothetical protein
MSFLTKDYKPLAPSRGGYMKLKPGENRIRILGSMNDTPPTAIQGVLGWVPGEEGKRKPVRTMPDQKVDASQFEEKPKEFIATIVFDHQAEQVCILELTQQSIIGEIVSLDNDPDWGDPRDYDISIIRTGDGLETRYNTVPKPKSAQTGEIRKAFADAKINLMALFSGDDPFAPVSGDGKEPF